MARLFVPRMIMSFKVDPDLRGMVATTFGWLKELAMVLTLADPAALVNWDWIQVEAAAALVLL
jgi:hypothetical protein